jgi:3-carboxy-cis,cis-muconate cycloisomerase
VIPFSAVFVPDDVAGTLSDRAWLAALLEAERALAVAEAEAGAITAESAAAIAAVCNESLYDVSELAHEGRASGNPVEPLVRRMRERVGDEHASAVHRGATSQDILDTAAMLVSRNALRIVDLDLEGLAAACARLADEHRATVMAARTLLQQAVPTTFGYKAAGWLVGVVEARSRLDRVATALPAQLGGAAGTLAALGGGGTEVVRLYAAELNLREPVLPWHTTRAPVAELGTSLAAAAGIAAKIAQDVVLLAQTEVAEVREGGDGGISSTMPHKRNPIAAVLALACERHARASAAVLIESMVAEHERAAGAWHAEWHALATALAAAGGAVSAVRRSLESLEIDAERMRGNLAPATLSEAERLGIAADAPEQYLGSIDIFVDRALALYRA